MAAERVVLTTELPGRTSPVPRRRGPPPGERPHPRAGLRGGLRREGGRAPLPDRPGPLPGRVRPGEGVARDGRGEPPGRPLPRRAPRRGSSRSGPRASRTTTTRPRRPCRPRRASRPRRRRSTAPAINLSYTPIRAPISGRTGRSSVTVGALVTAYQPVPLATIQQLDPIYVDVVQSSAELLRLAAGVPHGRPHPERLLLEQGQARPRGRNDLRARREAPVPGRDGRPDDGVGQRPDGLPEPRPRPPPRDVRPRDPRGGRPDGRDPRSPAGRHARPEGRRLLPSSSGRTARPSSGRSILDRAIGDRWLVTKGLAAGDRVIVEGLQRVRPGAEVKAVPFGDRGNAEPARRRPGEARARRRSKAAAMSRFFLKRPVFAWVVAIAMMLAGAMAI